jgi:hypothetical protein
MDWSILAAINWMCFFTHNNNVVKKRQPSRRCFDTQQQRGEECQPYAWQPIATNAFGGRGGGGVHELNATQ